jgi:hypothetical protein
MVSRNQSSSTGQKIWKKVDRAAKDVPQWIKSRVDESSTTAAKKIVKSWEGKSAKEKI